MVYRALLVDGSTVTKSRGRHIKSDGTLSDNAFFFSPFFLNMKMTDKNIFKRTLREKQVCVLPEKICCGNCGLQPMSSQLWY